MKNKERYAKAIIDVACSSYCFGMTRSTNKILPCSHCVFDGNTDCSETKRVWSESEYIEKPVISKRDRAFLEYIGTGINYITMDMDGGLFIYISKPHKLIDCWESGGIESNKSLKSFKLDFPNGQMGR